MRTRFTTLKASLATLLATTGTMAVLATATPAQADWHRPGWDNDGWRRQEWRERERRAERWREHEWRERHAYRAPRGYYAGPPVVAPYPYR